jgi:hypothetical protein
MKNLPQYMLLAALFSGCNQQNLDPRDITFLAAGEQAIVGSYTLDGLNGGKERVCTLEVLTNHTFVISNLPPAGSSTAISVTGTWSLRVYHVVDAPRYRVSFAGVTNIVNVRFPNADLPDGTTPTALSVWWAERQGQPVDYRFRQFQNGAPLQPRR